MKNVIFLVALLFGIVSSQTFTSSYFKNATLGTNGYDTAYGVALDSHNNTYFVGTTDNSLYGTWNDTANTPRTTDMIIAKHTATLNNGTLTLVWGVQIQSNHSDGAYAVVLDPSETLLYVCGTYDNNPWVGIVSPVNGSMIRSKVHAVTSASGNFPRFSDLALVGSSLYVVGYHFPNTTVRQEGLIVKMDSSSLAVQWSQSVTSIFDDYMYSVAYLTSAGRLFVAGETSRTSVGREMFLAEINPTNGSFLFQRIWPGTDCSSPDTNRDNVIVDLAVDPTGLYYLGITSQEFDSNGATTAVCGTTTAMLLGKLSLSNLTSHMWIKNVSLLSQGYTVEGYDLDIGGDGLLYIAGGTDADSLFGQSNSIPSGFIFDWFYYAVNASTAQDAAFLLQGSGLAVDEKATAIKTMTTEGQFSMIMNSNSLITKTDITVFSVKNFPDPTPSPSVTPTVTPSGTPSSSITPSITPSVSPSDKPESEKIDGKEAAGIAVGVIVAVIAIGGIVVLGIVCVKRRKASLSIHVEQEPEPHYTIELED